MYQAHVALMRLIQDCTLYVLIEEFGDAIFRNLCLNVHKQDLQHQLDEMNIKSFYIVHTEMRTCRVC